MGFEVPEWAKNVAMYAVSGFLGGFSAAFVLNPGFTFPELGLAIQFAATAGLYQAVKEVADYIKKLVAGKSTAAGPEAEPKPLLKRML